MEDNDKEQLRKGQTVSKATRISIEKGIGGNELWPLTAGRVSEKLDVIADTTREKRVVIIQVNGLPVVIQRGGFYWSNGSLALGELTCEEEGLVTSKGRATKVYGETMRSAGRGRWKKDNTGILKLEVSLNNCETKEKEVECSLNVVTKIS